MRFRRIILLAMCAIGVVGIVGCGMLGQDLQTVSDPEALFHVEVPVDWSARSQPGQLTLYADKTLPESVDAFGTAPWFFIYSRTTTDTAPLATQLGKLARQRAENRKWTATSFGKPSKTTLGGVPAQTMGLSATDDEGRSFEGALTLARTGADEVLVFAFARKGAFDQNAQDFVAEHFYWHNSSSGDKAQK